MSEENDWTAAVPGSLLKVKPADSEGQRQQDEKDDQQIYLGTMVLLAAKRGK